MCGSGLLLQNEQRAAGAVVCSCHLPEEEGGEQDEEKGEKEEELVHPPLSAMDVTESVIARWNARKWIETGTSKPSANG
jgi:hypothetical protein